MIAGSDKTSSLWEDQGVAMNPGSSDGRSAAAELADGLPESGTRRREILAFIVLAIVIWPILAVGIVGGYGFIVWMSQLIFGPPGPPPV
jgi:nitrate reductase NapE